MPKDKETIVWFDEVTKDNIPSVGGKGANLGEMTQANIPVPPGFIVTVKAYSDFLEYTNIIPKIRCLLKPLDPNNSKQLQQIAVNIKNVIMESKICPELIDQIKQAYMKMGSGLVAVRSSATAEDLPEASFAGQQSTYLNIQGNDRVVEAVQKCWASLFEPRAIYYRIQHGFEHFEVGIAVPVQKMISSETSGVMFTLEPVTSNTDNIIIEAIFGLGEGLVSGEITPDLYIINKKDFSITSREPSLAAREGISR